MQKNFIASEANEATEAYRGFGISAETESSWEDHLAEAHAAFILAFIEREQARDEAVLAEFLESH